jgi:hypothetical protein
LALLSTKKYITQVVHNDFMRPFDRHQAIETSNMGVCFEMFPIHLHSEICPCSRNQRICFSGIFHRAIRSDSLATTLILILDALDAPVVAQTQQQQLSSPVQFQAPHNDPQFPSQAAAANTTHLSIPTDPLILLEE